MQIRYRKFLEGSAGASSTKSYLPAVTASVTVAGAILGGLWVLFQFAYAKWVEPRLTAAVIHTSTELEYIGESKCCHLFEVVTRLENKGQRDVTIHASHQAVGARRVSVLDEASPDRIQQLTEEFLFARLPDIRATYVNAPTVEYVGTRVELPFLLISVGNVVRPGSQLAPAERHTSRSVAAVPKDHTVLSVRGSMFVSHFPSNDLDWYWTLQSTTLEPLPIPWRRADAAALAKLTTCVRGGDSEAQKMECARQVHEEAGRSFREAWQEDSKSYTQHYAADFFSLPPQTPKK